MKATELGHQKTHLSRSRQGAKEPANKEFAAGIKTWEAVGRNEEQTKSQPS